MWGGISYDPDLDLMYFGTANGTEWDQKHRSPGGGDNLYLASIIALKASTGEYAWYYQVVPGDVWDYDATQDVVLADLTIDGKLRKVAMQAGKDGYFYVLDRKTGELISANNFVPVNWAKGIDPKTGRPIEIHGSTLRQDRQNLPNHAGAKRRSQLAADGVQSADRTGLHPGARGRFRVRNRQEFQTHHRRQQHRHRSRSR